MTNKKKVCGAVRHYYADHLDGSLAVAERGHVDRHMRECSSCFEDYRSYVGVRDLLRAVPKTPAPYGFSDRVRFAIRREAEAASEVKASPFFSLVPRLVPVLGAAVFVVAAFAVIQMQRQTLAESPRAAVSETPSAAVAAQPASSHGEVATQVAEIDTLVKDINLTLAKQRSEEPIYLGGDGEHELVFDPMAVYRRPNQPAIPTAQASYETP